MTKAEKIELAASRATTAVAAAPQQDVSQEAKRRPLQSFRKGDCSASVWARDHVVRGESRRYFSVTFERSYRDSTGHYRYTRSFAPDDLGSLMGLCQLAAEYITALQDVPTGEQIEA